MISSDKPLTRALLPFSFSSSFLSEVYKVKMNTVKDICINMTLNTN
jgi:hypothetical protein